MSPSDHRVLVLAEVFPPKTGGSGRWLWEVYRRRPKSSVAIVAGDDAGAASFDRTTDMDITRLPLTFKSWSCFEPASAVQYVRALTRISRLVGVRKPDVLHCGKCLPEGLLALGVKGLRRIPYICYAHGEEFTLARTSRQLQILTSRVLRQASGVVANSTFTRDLLVNDWAVPSSRVAVVNPGVDTARFTLAPRDVARRDRLGWTNRRVVLTVGALQKRKGQDMMIRALPLIRAACPDVLYAIAGEGWERQYLEEQASTAQVSDAVQFLGTPQDEDLPALYQQCDIFALPNRQVGWDVEGFGIVLLEAQACGCPVIAGRSGGTLDTLRPGVTGELIDCSLPEALARAVIGLLTNPDRRADMGAAARQLMVDRFEWSQAGQRTHETLEAMIRS